MRVLTTSPMLTIPANHRVDERQCRTPIWWYQGHFRDCNRGFGGRNR